MILSLYVIGETDTGIRCPIPVLKFGEAEEKKTTNLI